MPNEEEQKPDPFLNTEEKTLPISPPVIIRGRYVKPKCAVCHEDGDGLHFGAEACRACTAFFRRSVALNKKYQCRGTGDCEVAANIRCMCRACRYQKCLDVGMNIECVQNRRENTVTGEDAVSQSTTIPGNVPPVTSTPSVHQIAVPIPSTSFRDLSLFRSEPSTSSFSPFSSLPGLNVASPSIESMPLLERMRINYEKMENARSVIHRRDGESIFQPKIPKKVNFREATEVTTKEVALVADWIEWCFDDFSVLPTQQKTILFQNFFIYFSMLERSFMTVKFGQEGVMVIASKDYIDYVNLEHFFQECGGPTKSCSTEELVKLIKPSFDLQQRSLINLLKIERVDQYEFFALCAMLFWDFGLEGQSDECNEVGRKVKHQVAREMTFYLRHVKRHEEPLYRMSSVVAVLPALQRAVRRFQEDIEMAHFFNIYALPENFYNIVNGKFS